MERRVAQGRSTTAPEGSWAGSGGGRWASLAIGLGLALAALLVYDVSASLRDFDPIYNHFLWQADAFLDGRAAIEYPVEGRPVENWYFNDVMELPGGGALLPFPPLPAVVLMPFVAVYGLLTDDQLISRVLGAIDVAICWWLVGRLGISMGPRIATTGFFAFGTVFWYAAELGTTWYFAHVVAVGLSLLAVGLAVSADPASVRDEDELPSGGDGPGPAASLQRALRSALGSLDGRQVLIGLLFGLACTARLSVAFGAPFFVLVGSGGTWQRRAVSAGIGAAVPIGLLLAYNVASSGSLIHAGYDRQYQLEANGYPQFGYHPEWAVTDPRYLPQNIGVALLGAPVLFPDEVPRVLNQPGAEPVCLDPAKPRGLFDADCPLILPRDIGMSLFLTSPAYLLAIPALRRLYGRSRLVTGAALAVFLIALFNLMHFSQGWVQFGWRFSNDFVAFALPLVALGIERVRQHRVIVGVLVGVSVAVNAWGVIWGYLLGW